MKPATREKINQIRALRKKGLTYREIGGLLNMRTTRVWDYDHYERYIATQRKWQQRNRAQRQYIDWKSQGSGATLRVRARALINEMTRDH